VIVRHISYELDDFRQLWQAAENECRSCVSIADVRVFVTYCRGVTLISASAISKRVNRDNPSSPTIPSALRELQKLTCRWKCIETWKPHVSRTFFSESHKTRENTEWTSNFQGAQRTKFARTASHPIASRDVSSYAESANLEVDVQNARFVWIRVLGLIWDSPTLIFLSSFRILTKTKRAEDSVELLPKYACLW